MMGVLGDGRGRGKGGQTVVLIPCGSIRAIGDGGPLPHPYRGIQIFRCGLLGSGLLVRRVEGDGMSWGGGALTVMVCIRWLSKSMLKLSLENIRRMM